MASLRYTLCVAPLLMATCASAGHGTTISAVWANEGGDKVTQDELRATANPAAVHNSIWNGTTISLFGAKNEVINFNLILEAATEAAVNVNVSLSNLTGPGGCSVIRSAPRAEPNLFNWTNTESELFYVRYLQIKGLSASDYGALQSWQEPTFPQRAQCPSGTGCAWAARPVANKFYPDIAVPLELMPNFTIAKANNQSIWADIYIPKSVAAGLYTGQVTITENGHLTHTVPISLNVRNFTLPDVPSSKTMLATSYEDNAYRYTGVKFPNIGTSQDLLTETVLQNMRLVAHRHKISLIGDDGPISNGSSAADRPSPGYIPALTGALFTAANGYAGPGAGTGNNVYSIGIYETWMTASWPATQAGFTANTNAWETWFEANSPATERFVYLCDESNCNNTPTLTTLLGYMPGTNTGAGANLHSMATQPLLGAPSGLSDPTSQWPYGDGSAGNDQSAANAVLAAEPARRLFAYASTRPGEGSVATEDDGTSLRELPWGQYKKNIDRWFIWESTYYTSYIGDTNVFATAQTFGGAPSADPSYGMIGPGASNGEGLLFYPGTDAIYPAVSYGIAGPIASLRLKYWRRGIQDVDYLTLANAVNPAAVANLVQQMVPNALWENQCHDLTDCTYFEGPISWSSVPDQWEAARLQLANIIDPP